MDTCISMAKRLLYVWDAFLVHHVACQQKICTVQHSWFWLVHFLFLRLYGINLIQKSIPHTLDNQIIELFVKRMQKIIKKSKVYSTRYSQAVTHPSTNRARRCLTSVIGREPLFSTWYGRRHYVTTHLWYISYHPGPPWPKFSYFNVCWAVLWCLHHGRHKWMFKWLLCIYRSLHKTFPFLRW